ncbi:MAG: hypothetical protein CM15mP120_26820 [Pseudomonadota bacterium]|nr:MAG: hypothetical protein CM15mP120_26820 [Pseudomonadota bacterium]
MTKTYTRTLNDPSFPRTYRVTARLQPELQHLLSVLAHPSGERQPAISWG